MLTITEKLSSKETVLPHEWGNETLKFSITGVDKGQFFYREEIMKLTFGALKPFIRVSGFGL